LERVSDRSGLVLRTTSADQTRSLARSVAPLCAPGDVVLLAGGLGAGKTTFAQGFGAGLGITEAITSPTFTLVRPYPVEGRAAEDGDEPPVRTLWHADLYRLDRLHEIVDLGLGQLVEDGGVALIEWGDVAEPVLGDGSLAIALAVEDDADDHRLISVRATGSTWATRWKALEAGLAPWQVAS
jgi:tRNA threonylcarbamoyladenosine biosynthesis protein TsaE